MFIRQWNVKYTTGIQPVIVAWTYIYITAKTSLLFWPQSGYCGCSQALVMRYLLWYLYKQVIPSQMLVVTISMQDK